MTNDFILIVFIFVILPVFSWHCSWILILNLILVVLAEETIEEEIIVEETIAEKTIAEEAVQFAR